MVRFVYRMPGKSWGSFYTKKNAIEALRKRYEEEGAVVRILF